MREIFVYSNRRLGSRPPRLTSAVLQELIRIYCDGGNISPTRRYLDHIMSALRVEGESNSAATPAANQRRKRSNASGLSITDLATGAVGPAASDMRLIVNEGRLTGS